MPHPPPRPCTWPGCPTLVTNGRCPQHRTSRPTAARRGYSSQHRDRFRAGVLARDPACVICGNPADTADHHPKSRRQLEAEGLDPNDPAYGRGLCHDCHSRETAKHQPGGWNDR